MQQEGVISVLRRGHAQLETPEFVVRRVEPARPVLLAERGIGDDEIEGLQAAVPLLPVRGGERDALPDHRCDRVVQDHVHARECTGGVVVLLAEDGQSTWCLIVHLEQ